eukprot:TRINITY_DN1430_c1_g2_i1.p1 TRINITY_DN1430_c1_g2~~TRINITY_DN1430_c1_g2_i1.p1  ORF type:complete len:1159 (+),score=305.50 TRINITY_DN1430_c1_g2_i1:80-3556(+)
MGQGNSRKSQGRKLSKKTNKVGCATTDQVLGKYGSVKSWKESKHSNPGAKTAPVLNVDGYFSHNEQDLESDLPLMRTGKFNKSFDYRKGNLLGAGAFGQVYLGLHQGTGELIAVKMVHMISHDQSSQTQFEELEQEIRLMKSLEHPNIVKYFGSKQTTEAFEIYMEYIPGGTLRSLLKKFGKFNEVLIKVYTKQILEGLDYLHRHRVLHRDIKGANILVDSSGICKLSDFGASRILNKITAGQQASMRGTPYWMAPEVVNQQSPGRQADIWSVGCTIIEMATGQPPFSEFNQIVALMKIASIKEPPALPDGISPLLTDFLSVCLKIDPKQRSNARTLLNHPFLMRPTSPKRSRKASSSDKKKNKNNKKKKKMANIPSEAELIGNAVEQIGGAAAERSDRSLEAWTTNEANFTVEVLHDTNPSCYSDYEDDDEPSVKDDAEVNAQMTQISRHLNSTMKELGTKLKSEFVDDSFHESLKRKLNTPRPNPPFFAALNSSDVSNGLSFNPFGESEKAQNHRNNSANSASNSAQNSLDSKENVQNHTLNSSCLDVMMQESEEGISDGEDDEFNKLVGSFEFEDDPAMINPPLEDNSQAIYDYHHDNNVSQTSLNKNVGISNKNLFRQPAGMVSTNNSGSTTFDSRDSGRFGTAVSQQLARANMQMHNENDMLITGQSVETEVLMSSSGSKALSISTETLSETPDCHARRLGNDSTPLGTNESAQSPFDISVTNLPTSQCQVQFIDEGNQVRPLQRTDSFDEVEDFVSSSGYDNEFINSSNSGDLGVFSKDNNMGNMRSDQQLNNSRKRSSLGLPTSATYSLNKTNNNLIESISRESSSREFSYSPMDGSSNGPIESSKNNSPYHDDDSKFVPVNMRPQPLSAERKAKTFYDKNEPESHNKRIRSSGTSLMSRLHLRQSHEPIAPVILQEPSSNSHSQHNYSGSITPSNPSEPNTTPVSYNSQHSGIRSGITPNQYGTSNSGNVKVVTPPSYRSTASNISGFTHNHEIYKPTSPPGNGHLHNHTRAHQTTAFGPPPTSVGSNQSSVSTHSNHHHHHHHHHQIQSHESATNSTNTIGTSWYHLHKAPTSIASGGGDSCNSIHYGKVGVSDLEGQRRVSNEFFRSATGSVKSVKDDDTKFKVMDMKKKKVVLTPIESKNSPYGGRI